MSLTVTHSKTLVAPDSGTEDKVYGADYVSPSSHTIVGGDLLGNVTGTDADTAMAVNTRYIVDMSAWATADRTYTLPAVFAVGDVVEIVVRVGDASHELIYTAAAGDTCNAVAGGTEVSRLFITGEVVRFVGVVANTAWNVEFDGRIAQKGVLRLSTSAAAEVAATLTRPTDKSGVWTADTDNAAITDVATGQIKTRRAGFGTLAYTAGSVNSVADAKYFSVGLWKNGVVSTIVFSDASNSRAGFPRVGPFSIQAAFAVDDYVVYQFRSEEGGRGLIATAAPYLASAFSFTEMLP